MRLFAALLLAMIPAVALAGPSIEGSFQGWDPADPEYELTINGNGVYVLTKILDAGTHEYKGVDGDTYAQDFPALNQIFSLGASEPVTWYVNLGATVLVKEEDEYVFHHMNPPIVCGDFMSELGGEDWDETNTTLTVMSDPDLDDVWEWESVIPAGNYEFKIVLNNTWDQNTSPPGNLSFGSDGTTPVLFRYHMADNTTEVFSEAAPTVVWARSDGLDGPVLVKFSKDVEEISAQNPANYSLIERVFVITSATRDADDHSLVYLGFTPDLTTGGNYEVEVNNVTDLSGRPVNPNFNTGCFYMTQVIFEVNMHLFVEVGGTLDSLHIQGDTEPLTWDPCAGSRALDDGMGYDLAAGDTTYTVAEYFSVSYPCDEMPGEVQVKYKYLVDCTLWEGDFNFGHYVTLKDTTSQRVNVWWADVAPSDFTVCDVGVRFQVTSFPDTFVVDTLSVLGSVAPLTWDWPPSSVDQLMVDDGTNGDLVPGDGIYTALIVFPTGSYRFLNYKYRNNGVYECIGLPDRNLVLDDVNGCMPPTRDGPMEVLDIWNWCEPVTGVQELTIEKSWGEIKSLFR